MLFKQLTALLILVLSPLASFSQIVINEVCSANDSIIQSIDERYDDWIELYNTSNQAINLNGYSLTNAEDYTTTWKFPEIIIQPNGYLTIFCPQKDLRSVIDHVEIPVPPGDTWKYQIDSAAYNPAWVLPGYNDASWLSGPAGFGIGNDFLDLSLINTTIDTAGVGRIKSIFIRKTLFIADTSSISFGVLFNRFDDGFVSYVNGVEVERFNITGNPPINTDYAITDIEPSIQTAAIVDKSLFVPGVNVIAIQVHNVQNQVGFFDDILTYPYFLMAVEDTTVMFPSPPFLPPIYLCDKGLHTNFNLSSLGQKLILKDANGNIADEAVIGTMNVNHSRGRYPDGSSTWRVFDAPTPCGTNNLSTAYTAYAEAPVITPESQFFNPTLSVSISPPSPSANIYYTLDGSEPLTSDALYSAPFTIDSSLVVRARNYDSDPSLLPSKIVSVTYLNENITLPVVSITTDPYNLWDWDYGIYVMGPNASPIVPYNGANFTMGWERQAHVDYFDKDNLYGFGNDCKIKIHGNFSKSWPQKSFRILANDDYGTTWFNYSGMFPNKTVNKFKSFNVRNAGIDWNTCHMRDGFMHMSVRGLHMDIMDFQPGVVFVNGDYFGVFGIRERQDEHYLAKNNNVREDQIDLLRFEGDVLHGSNKAFFDMVDYIVNNDLSIQSKFDLVADSMLDVINVADYFITELYYANVDWIGENGSNNIKFWRTHTPAGKWRYILWDTDLGTGLFDPFAYAYNHLAQIATYTNSNHVKILGGLFDNPEYVQYFINRYADLINTIFHPDNTLKLVDEITAEMEPEMARHFNLWGVGPITIFGIVDVGRATDIPSWKFELNLLKNFLLNRPAFARLNIQNNFSMVKQVGVTLDVSPAKAGEIHINTITPDSLPWTGIYFDGNPIQITASAKPGYRFKYWQSNTILTDPVYTESLDLNVYTNDQFTAYFEPIDHQLTAIPNPAYDMVTVNISIPEEKTQAILRIYDLNGKAIHDIIPSGSFLFSGDYSYQVNLETLGIGPGMYFISLTTTTYSKTIKLIKTR